MFDEIEDAFPSQGGWRALFGMKSKESGEASGNAWINRTLERNTTPAIWITNNANIDQAYLRRFDYSIRFPVPPQKVRMEIARHHLGQFNPSEAWLARIAANEQMTCLPACCRKSKPKIAQLQNKKSKAHRHNHNVPVCVAGYVSMKRSPKTANLTWPDQ